MSINWEKAKGSLETRRARRRAWEAWKRFSEAMEELQKLEYRENIPQEFQGPPVGGVSFFSSTDLFQEFQRGIPTSQYLMLNNKVDFPAMVLTVVHNDYMSTHYQIRPEWIIYPWESISED